jgi:hypothetical protein
MRKLHIYINYYNNFNRIVTGGLKSFSEPIFWVLTFSEVFSDHQMTSPRLVLGLAQAFNSLSFAKNGHSSLPEILELVYAERCHQAYVITRREPTSSNDEILLLAALICCQDEKIPREDILNVLVSRMERALSMDKELVSVKGPNKRDIERVASEIAAMLSRQILKGVDNNDEDGFIDVSSRMLPLRRVLAAAAQVGLLSDQGRHESSTSAVLYAAIINCLLHSARSALSSPNETRKQRLKQTSDLVDAASMFLEDALTVLSLIDMEFFGNNLSSSHELLETFPTAILDKKRMISSVEADAAELLLVLVSGGAIDSKRPGSGGALGLRKVALELIAPSTGLSVDEAQSFTKLDRSLSNLLEASRWVGN